jgi:hypothetical protein
VTDRRAMALLPKTGGPFQSRDGSKTGHINCAREYALIPSEA